MTASCKPRGRAAWAGAVARRAIVTALAAGLLALGPPAGAEESGPPVRLQRPWALRGTGAIFAEPHSFLIGGANNDLLAGVTVSRQVLDRLALEVLAGGGGNLNRSGLHLGGNLRYSPLAGRVHALTVSLGGRVGFLRDYGPLGIGHLEAGWELRLPSGFDLAASCGLGVVLNDTRAVTPCVTHAFLCEDRYRAGDLGGSWRLEIGASF